MRMLAVLAISSLGLAACGGPPAAKNDDQATVEANDGGSFLEREKQRSEENDENRRKALEAIHGISPENADADRGEGTP